MFDVDAYQEVEGGYGMDLVMGEPAIDAKAPRSGEEWFPESLAPGERVTVLEDEGVPLSPCRRDDDLGGWSRGGGRGRRARRGPRSRGRGPLRTRGRGSSRDRRGMSVTVRFEGAEEYGRRRLLRSTTTSASRMSAQPLCEGRTDPSGMSYVS